MTAHIEAVTTGFIAFAGASMGRQTARLLAEVTGTPMPEWMTWLVGPLGALAGLVIALVWMNKRLDRTETKAEERQAAQDKESRDERDRLIVALERSTVATDHIKEVLLGCQSRTPKP